MSKVTPVYGTTTTNLTIMIPLGEKQYEDSIFKLATHYLDEDSEHDDHNGRREEDFFGQDDLRAEQGHERERDGASDAAVRHDELGAPVDLEEAEAIQEGNLGNDTCRDRYIKIHADSVVICKVLLFIDTQCNRCIGKTKMFTVP